MSGRAEGRTKQMTMTVHDHRVGFFADDQQLVVEAARFVSDGLAQGSDVLVIATASHRALIEASAFPGGRGRYDGAHYVALDAESTLRELMAGGVPRLDRLVSTVGDLVGRSSGRRVRAYGEMVALLWQRGDVAEAIALEGLWNDLARELDLDLLCSYSVEALGTSDLHQLQQMCREHSAFVTPDASSPTTEEHVAGARSRSRVFLPAPQAVSATRRFVADVLADWGQAPLVEDGVLIASELATNAVVHGGSPFRTSVRVQDDSVLIEVEDAHAGTPQRGPARLEGLDGRGIAIVEDLSHRSGCTRLPDSKVLWAELAAC